MPQLPRCKHLVCIMIKSDVFHIPACSGMGDEAEKSEEESKLEREGRREQEREGRLARGAGRPPGREIEKEMTKQAS